MDVAVRILEQYRKVRDALSPQQRLRIGMVSAAVLIGFGWLLVHHSRQDYVSIPLEATSSAGDPDALRQTLLAAGLSDVRLENGVLRVPVADEAAARSALTASAPDVGRLAEELERAQDGLSFWSRRHERDAARVMARTESIRKTIADWQGIAKVEIWPSEGLRPAGASRARAEAKVVLTPEEGRTLTRPLVEAVRQLVAGISSELQPDAVIIIDGSTRALWNDQLADAIDTADTVTDEPFAQAAAQRTHYQQQIEHALSFIDGVLVSVAVVPAREVATPSVAGGFQQRSVEHVWKPADDVPLVFSAGTNRPMSIEPTFLPPPVVEREAESTTLPTFAVGDSTPPGQKEISVTVSVPEQYLRDFAAARPSTAERLPSIDSRPITDVELARREVEGLIRTRIARFLPDGGQAGEQRIYVETIPMISGTPENWLSSSAQRASSLLAAIPQRGQVAVVGAVGLLLVYVFALSMRFRRRRGFRRLHVQVPEMPTQAARNQPDSIRLPAATERVREQVHTASPKADATEPATERNAHNGDTSLATPIVEFLAGHASEDWLPLVISSDTESLSGLASSLPGDALDEVCALLPEETQRTLRTASRSHPPMSTAAQRRRVSEWKLQLRSRRPATIPVEVPVAPRPAARQDVAATRTAAREPQRSPVNSLLSVDEISTLEAGVLSELYGTQPVGRWVAALTGVSERVRDHLLRSISPVQRSELEQALQKPRPLRLRDVEQAQNEILEAIGAVTT